MNHLLGVNKSVLPKSDAVTTLKNKPTNKQRNKKINK